METFPFRVEKYTRVCVEGQIESCIGLQLFFILGPGEGGWEFSALLIACFAAVALDYRPAQVDAGTARLVNSRNHHVTDT